MQLDADEDGEPFFKPQQVNAAPTASSTLGVKEEGAGAEHSQQSPENDDRSRVEEETAQAAIPIATTEQEE